MKVNAEIRSCILKACKGEIDNWQNGNSPEIVLDALDELSDDAKLELCLRYLPEFHTLTKVYARMEVYRKPKPEKPRDYTPTTEARGI